MVEKPNNQNLIEIRPENEMAQIFGMLSEKKAAEADGEKRDVSEELLELKEGKRIPGLVLEEINEKIQSKRVEKEKTLKEYEEQFGEDMDSVMLEKQLEFFRKKNEEELNILGIEYIDTYEALYADERFKIASFNFLRKEMYKDVDNAFKVKDVNSIKDIDRTAVMFLDLNGLKAVNDLSLDKHKSGDNILEVTSEILDNGKTKKWLESLDVKVVAVRKSGDEFIMQISGDIPVSLPSEFDGINGEKIKDTSIVEYALQEIKKEFEEDKRFGSIFNFSKKEQRKVFEDNNVINPDEWKDFKFKGSISGGTASFLDVLKKLDINKQELEEMVWKDVVKKIMGEMIDISDKKMMAAKKEEKQVDSIQNRILEFSGR